MKIDVWSCLLVCLGVAPSIAFAQTVPSDAVYVSSSPACIYAGESYSEGAVLPQGKFTMVCMVRGGIQVLEFDKKAPPRELVWESLGSARLERFRKENQLGDK